MTFEQSHELGHKGLEVEDDFLGEFSTTQSHSVYTLTLPSVTLCS
jgi:hypothetical protein